MPCKQIPSCHAPGRAGFDSTLPASYVGRREEVFGFNKYDVNTPAVDRT